MVYSVTVLLIAVFGYLLWRERLFINKTALLMGVLLLAFPAVLRLFFFDYATLDYKDFLLKWVEYFRLHGGVAALKDSIGNYNVPYLYFLAIFSYIPVNDLYLIKLLSLCFDYVLAYAGMKLVSLFTESITKRLVIFFLILLLPSVVLNGSVWAQCDSIYAAFAVLSFYFVLSGRPVLSMVMIALAFGFKLQAIFIMPIFLACLFCWNLKIRHLFVFPLTYVLLVLPAVIAGRPILETITLYMGQTGSIGTGLNYNSPSVFAFYKVFIDPSAGTLGIFAAGVSIFIFSLVLYFNRTKLKPKVLLISALIFTIAFPFLLPHMHERYFFMADILSLCYAVVNPKRFHIPVLVSFASLLGYYAYLMKVYFLPMSFGATALILALLFLFYDLYITLRSKSVQDGKLA